MADFLPPDMATHLRKIATPAHVAQYVTRDLPDDSEAKWLPFKHHLYMNDVLTEACTSSLRSFINLSVTVRHGKALDVDTSIITPDGWKRIGDLRVGDFVYNEKGRPVEVTEAFPAYWTDGAYRVDFSDGSDLVADGPHRWTCYSYAESQNLGQRRRYAGSPHRVWPEDWATDGTASVRTTVEMAAEDRRFYIPLTLPIEGVEQELPIDPYLLGVWLGDGTTASGAVTTADPEVMDSIRALGYKVIQPPSMKPYGYSIYGFKAQLRDLGVLNNKHIPELYLRGTVEQRLALLRGLMDSDGGVEKSLRNTGRVSFTNQNQGLVRSTGELLVGLGCKVTYDERQARCSGVLTGKTAYRVSSSPTVQPFKLRRKADLWADDSKGSLTRRTRAVKAVTPASGRMVRCISVASPGSLYLAGESMIPTHNSELVSRWLPFWYLGMYPDRDVLIVSNSSENAQKWGLATLQLMKQWGMELFGLQVDPANNAKGSWGLKGRKGSLRAVGMGAQIEGRGVHLGVIDDPIGIAEAYSPAEREHTWEWYTGQYRTRLMPGATTVLCMSRWHMEDLAGKIENHLADHPEGDPWVTIKLPAIAEAPKGADLETWTNPIGQRHGEPLWPEKWPLPDLEQLRNSMQAVTWESRYQQNPTPAEGGMFKVKNWRRAPHVERRTLRMVRCWDLASTEDGGDWTVGVLMGIDSASRVYVLDVQRFQKDSAGVKRRVRDQAKLDGRMVPIRIEQERAGAGKAQIQDYKRYLIGYDVRGRKPEGSKEQRAAPYASQQQNENVYLVDPGNDWAKVFIEEHRVFLKGRHDDQVDAAAGAFDELAEAGEVIITTPQDADVAEMDKLLEAGFGASPNWVLAGG